MLFLLFQIGNDRYVIEGNKIIEIIPNLKIKPVLKAPDYVTGLLNYRGEVIPVIDINKLCIDKFTSSSLSSRIVIIKYLSINKDELKLGLNVEKATETIDLNRSDFEVSTIKIKDASYFGELVKTDNGIIQLLEVEKILPNEIREALYSNNKLKVNAG